MAQQAAGAAASARAAAPPTPRHPCRPRAAGVKVDKTKPTISASASGTHGSNGWYKGPVTVAFSCSDPAGANGAAASGIATCPAAEVIGNGANQTVSGIAEDKADNKASTSAGPFNVDRRPTWVPPISTAPAS